MTLSKQLTGTSIGPSRTDLERRRARLRRWGSRSPAACWPGWMAAPASSTLTHASCSWRCRRAARASFSPSLVGESGPAYGRVRSPGHVLGLLRLRGGCSRAGSRLPAGGSVRRVCGCLQSPCPPPHPGGLLRHDRRTRSMLDETASVHDGQGFESPTCAGSMKRRCLRVVYGDVQYQHYRRKHHNTLTSAGLAQLVEHLICNQGVIGSNPVAGTNKISKLRTQGWAARKNSYHIATTRSQRRPPFHEVTNLSKCLW